MKLLVSHEEVYDEFRRIVEGLDPGHPHTIRTINSFIAEKDIERDWDKYLVEYLARNRSTQLVRVIAYRETPEWTERLDRLKRKYEKVSNYRQVNWKRPSMPTIEMFLVDRDDVVLSFASEDVPNPQVNAGIRIRDPEFCERLETYHRTQLEQKYPTEDFHQLALPQQ